MDIGWWNSFKQGQGQLQPWLVSLIASSKCFNGWQLTLIGLIFVLQAYHFSSRGYGHVLVAINDSLKNSCPHVSCGVFFPCFGFPMFLPICQVAHRFAYSECFESYSMACRHGVSFGKHLQLYYSSDAWRFALTTVSRQLCFTKFTFFRFRQYLFRTLWFPFVFFYLNVNTLSKIWLLIKFHLKWIWRKRES